MIHYRQLQSLKSGNHLLSVKATRRRVDQAHQHSTHLLHLFLVGKSSNLVIQLTELELDGVGNRSLCKQSMRRGRLSELDSEGVLFSAVDHTHAATEASALLLSEPCCIAFGFHGLTNLLHAQRIGDGVAEHDHTTTQERTGKVLECVLRNGEEHAESISNLHLVLRFIPRLLAHVRHFRLSLGHLERGVLLAQRVETLHHIVVRQVDVLNHDPTAVLHRLDQRTRSEEKVLLPVLVPADRVSSDERVGSTVVVQIDRLTPHGVHLRHVQNGVGFAGGRRTVHENGALGAKRHAQLVDRQALRRRQRPLLERRVVGRGDFEVPEASDGACVFVLDHVELHVLLLAKDSLHLSSVALFVTTGEHQPQSRFQTQIRALVHANLLHLQHVTERERNRRLLLRLEGVGEQIHHLLLHALVGHGVQDRFGGAEQFAERVAQSAMIQAVRVEAARQHTSVRGHGGGIHAAHDQQLARQLDLSTSRNLEARMTGVAADQRQQQLQDVRWSQIHLVEQ